ncbi:uncharacterized protein LOC106065782 isoform X3 [Biomphalaria glabrata]|uniref:Uncharacterized protein LOC106065782 isoform X3 n=1 Tax=Biomphalaria glabrata TaxID=6526 RepID=A0A9W3AAW7_BIOGL|nr:uncharacterized protein LOC106065782 isoform X3 [Biomphalaria glabrata]
MTTSQTATVTSTRRTSKSVPNLSTDISNLFEAIGEGKIETVKVILEMAKDPAELLRMKDLQGLTPLRKAVALNKAEIARILVAYGAEPSVRDPAGRTVLHIAVMQGRRELIAPLLVSKDSCVNVQDSHGWSPLHFAVRGKHIHAINWLLYAGADISLKNKEDKTAMDLCDEDSPIRAMLAKYERALDDGPLDLCSSFIGRKQLNQIGPDGLLMFVTSSIWSERMQFIFCIRIRPYRAMPPIPLRLDEQYYSDVWHYRMMRRLSPKETRVKAYFRLFEELIDTEIVLKITSKRKFLGEIPFTLSKYTQFNYTSFLAGAEMDLKDEGQFVMVKRPISYMLLKDQDGIYSNRHCGMFKFNLPDGVLPNPPPEWNNTRYDREWEEAEAMMKKLLPETESETNEATVTEKQVVWGDRNMNADAAPDVEATPEGGKGAEDGKDGAGGEEKEPGENEEEEEEEEDWPGGIRPGTILEGDEPDECADFYFISKGWALYLQLLHPLPLHMLIDKSIFERNAIRCITDFYKVFHTSNKQPTEKCMMQIPKTPEFVRVGTILVFARRELFPDEVEFPDPDDTPEEYFLSSDGKNTWGAYWILKEKERWSVIPSGLVNKQSRLIFETKTLTTFIAMQLTHGSQKWESELPGDSSSEEEEEEEAVEVKEGEGEEEPKEEVVEEEGEESAEKKKKKKKKKPMSEIKVQESADDSSNDEIEGSVTEFTFNPVDGSNGSRRETAGGSMIMEAPPESSSPQLQGSPSGSPQMTPQMKPSKQATDHDKKDISPNKTRRNHCECVASIFSRFRDGVYDLAIELVKASELYVRAENWWGEGYRMIAQTPTFPAKSGRLFNFLLDGPMVVESPVTHVTGSVSQRSMFYYLSTVSCLEYVVKKATKDEDVKPGGAKKGPRKKDDKADQEPDCRLDIMQYSPGSRTNGLDIASLNIFLNAADLWHQRHVELRSSDNVLLNSLIKILKKEKAFKHKWWRIVLLLGYPEKEIETEKGKTKWSVIIANLLTKWFEDNLNAPDRGILKLISVLSIMELHNTIESLLSGIRDYKGTLLTSKKEPRYLKLLFHWVLNTKITRNNIMRLIDPQILKPVSDIFLLRMSLLLDPGQIYKIGAAMDVEDNVIHAVQDEESIKDSVYFPFRVLIKSRQKKDEIIHYTLLLLEMTKQCNFQEAQQFLITETKKWMITVAETEPDICAKLDNVFS